MDPKHFTGEGLFQALLGRDDGLPVRVYRVSFEQDARTNWHWHDGVQVLYGLEGSCEVVNRRGQRCALEPGGVVVIDPNDEHWHGAAPGGAGAHLAINLGQHTEWLEAAMRL